MIRRTLISRFGSERTKFLFANRQIDRLRRLFSYPIQEIVAEREAVLDDPQSVAVIPRVLVQTFMTTEVIRPIHSAITRWQEINPEFAYRFFNDDACRDFIKRNFPSRVLRAYDSLIPGAYKADLWRYCYLAKNGGVYTDVRSEPICALRTILSTRASPPLSFVSSRDMAGDDLHGRAYLYNAFIAAVPSHPFVVTALERTIDNVLNRNYGRDLLDITGPACFGAAANTVLGRPIDFHFELGDHFHEEAGNYRILDQQADSFHRFVLTDRGRALIATKCIHPDIKLLDRRVRKRRYAFYYDRRKVFRDPE